MDNAGLSAEQDKLFQEYIEHLRTLPKTAVMMPIEDRVLVLPDAAESTSKGGIIIPDSAKEEQTKGMVLATGKSTLRGTEILVQAGDLVAYTKFAGSDLKVHGITLRCIRYADIALLFGQVVREEPKEKTDVEA